MNNTSRQVIRIIFTVVAICALVYGLWLIRAVIIYILLSAVFAIIGKPIVDSLAEKKKISRTIAAVITLVIMVGTFAGMMAIFIPSLIRELSVISEIQVDELFTAIDQNLTNVEDALNRQHLGIGNLREIIGETLAGIFNFNTVSNSFQTLIGEVGYLLFASFSILFITFFFLREKYLFRNIILAIVPDEYEENILRISPRLKRSLSRYFLGLLIQMTIFTLLVSAGLYLIGFDNFIVIAFFAGLMNMIPYLGPIIGMLFGLVLGLSANIASEFSMDPLGLSVLIIAVFAVAQMIDNFILQPFIFSNSIYAHPLEIFLVVSIAAILGGIPAMIIAVPSYSVVRLLAREFFPHIKMVQRLTQNLKKLDEPRPD